jgi:hypothetical protein
MRRLFLSSIIAFLAISLGLYAQKDTAQAEPKVNLKVVYEKTFDEPILDVIFDTVTVTIEEAKSMGWKEEAFTEEGKGKVLASYPKVVLISRGRELDWYVPERRSSYYTKEIRFYDRDGKIINRLPLKEFGEEYVYLSPQQKYILIAKIPTEWAPGYSGGILYDLNGNKIWEIEGPTPIAVSDEGYAVAAYLDWDVPPKPGGDFYVYDSKGKLLTTIENPLKEKTAPLFAKYSKDGGYAILGFIKPTYPPTALVLITKEGKIIWKKELPEYRFSARQGCNEEIDILPYKGVGLSGGFFIDWQGNLKWKRWFNAGANRGCIFSQDKQKFYIYGAKGHLYSLNLDTGSIIGEYKQVWNPADKIFWFVEMYELNQYIVVKGHPNKIFIFDGGAEKLKAEIEYPGKRIFLSLHNGRIFVIDVEDKKILGLKIEEE